MWNSIHQTPQERLRQRVLRERQERRQSSPDSRQTTYSDPAIPVLLYLEWGPFGVVQMSSNPWVNGFIAAVFAMFALSLLGAFEITLPSGLLTKMDHASRRGGYLGTLLMGLTFSLTSFACVGPFVGPLLASSATSAIARP